MIRIRNTIESVPLQGYTFRRNPLVIPAAVAAAGSLLGGLLGRKSTSDTNKMNLQIAREQNEFNRAQWERERDFTVQQWNAQNEYNSPASQVARYREAGLNPFLMMSAGDAGVAQSVSTPSGDPAVGASLQPYDYSAIGEAGNSAVQAYLGAQQANIADKAADAQIDLVKSQADALKFENAFNIDTRGLKLRELEALVGRTEEEHNSARMDNTIKFGNMPYVFREMRNRVKEQEAGISYTEANTVLAGMQADLMETNNKIALEQFRQMPIRLKYDIAVSNSQILANRGAAAAGFGSAYASRMQGEFTDAQRRDFNKRSYQRTISFLTGNIMNMAQAQNYKVSAETAQQLARIQINQYIRDLPRHTWDTDLYRLGNKLPEWMRNTYHIVSNLYGGLDFGYSNYGNDNNSYHFGKK